MLELGGRTVIVVDDGIATGSTAVPALQIARANGAHRVVLAAPVSCSTDAAVELAREADDVVVLETPTPFFAIGPWYADFSQIHRRRGVPVARGVAASDGPSERGPVERQGSRRGMAPATVE